MILQSFMQYCFCSACIPRSKHLSCITNMYQLQMFGEYYSFVLLKSQNNTETQSVGRKKSVLRQVARTVTIVLCRFI